MMVNFDELRFARPSWLVHPIIVWSELDAKLAQWEHDIQSHITLKLQQSGWQGPAADAAFAQLASLRERVSVASIEATAIVAMLRGAQEEFERCQATLDLDIQEAVAQRFEVVPLGTLTTDVMADGTPIDTPEERTFRDAQRLQLEERFAMSVSTATNADVNQSGMLGKLRPIAGPNLRSDALKDLAAATTAAGVAVPLIPKDPKAAADWWRGLTLQQQEMYLLLHPQQIGSTDGLPAVIRDQANQDFLEQRIRQLQAQTTFAGDGDRVKRDTELANLLRVQDSLNKNVNLPPQQQLMLLKFDGEGQGRIVYSVGNPDTAQHVAVYVPGTGAEGNDLQDLNRGVNLQDAADRLTPNASGDVATIVWVDYDAPDHPAKDAPFDHYAEAGAPRLDSYINGLRANVPTQHVSVVAHSYGSTLVGDAARSGDGLAVDDIVVAGSPGMHVDSADDLHIDPRHVWAQEADGDYVPGIGQYGHGGWTWRHGYLTPSEAPFGGNITTTDGSGHSDYWNRDSVSLNNQAAVVVGQYTQVQLEHGSAPQ